MESQSFDIQLLVNVAFKLECWLKLQVTALLTCKVEPPARIHSIICSCNRSACKKFAFFFSPASLSSSLYLVVSSSSHPLHGGHFIYSQHTCKLVPRIAVHFVVFNTRSIPQIDASVADQFSSSRITAAHQPCTLNKHRDMYT